MSDGDSFGADEGDESRMRSDIFGLVAFGGRTGAFVLLAVEFGEVRLEGVVELILLF